MKVEVLVGANLDSIWAWAETRAAQESISTADLVARALAHERHRLKEGPRMDPRTKQPGKRGAASTIPPGSLHSKALAERLHVNHDQVLEAVRAGVVRSDEPLSRGRATTFTPVEAFAVGVAVPLLGLVRNRLVGEAATLARANAESWRGKTIVVADSEGAILVGDAHLGHTVRQYPAAVVVSLERVGLRLLRVDAL